MCAGYAGAWVEWWIAVEYQRWAEGGMGAGNFLCGD